MKEEKMQKSNKKIINKTEELEKQFEEAKKETENRLNQLKYLQADFDNYRKKFDKEKEQIVKLAEEGLIKELIILLDDFNSSIKLIDNEKNKQGIEMIHKKFFNILEKHGLKAIDAVGKRFNPDFHEVLCKVFSEYEDGIILEEIQKGYTLYSKVLRPSKVKIAEKEKQDLKATEVKN